MRYGATGYVYAFTEEVIYTVHPFRAEWVGGASQRNLQDQRGDGIFDLIFGALDSKGHSITTFYFENPATGQVEPKLNYTQLYEPWGWYIGTGEYASGIDARISAIRIAAFGGLAVGLSLLLIISFLITRSILRPITALSGRMLDMKEGNLTTEVPALNDKSEIGQMAHSVETFRLDLEKQKALELEQLRKDRERQDVIALLSDRLARLAEGDLATRIIEEVPVEYGQVTDDFNTAVAHVENAVGNVIAGVHTINHETGSLESASNELSRRTETQAASLEETTAALNELSHSVRGSATESQEARLKVDQASHTANNGAEVVKRTIEAMNGIEESSKKISNITNLIDDIAFQTNLLALNAGVEAARAGGAGLGFAVVASEVRALAGKSSDAAQEIAKLIDSASKEVQTGASLVQDSGEVLNNINDLIGSIKQTVNRLADSAQAQSASLSEITAASEQLDMVNQQNAAMFEETTAATQRLRDETAQLAQNANRFSVNSKDRIDDFNRDAASAA